MSDYTYKYAVIVGLDGMGNFNREADTPRMDAIFENGAKTYYGTSLYPTISAQNWGAMLLGTLPEVHGLTNGIVGSRIYENKELPSVFTTVRRAFPDAFLCSCSNWNPINYGIIEHDIGVEMHSVGNDGELTEIIEECVSRRPKLLFIQMDDPDGAGHGNGYGTQGHLDQIHLNDSYVGRVYDAYVKAGIIEDTLFIAIADHGGYGRGHGGYSDEEKNIFFAVAGKTVRKGEIPAAQTKDINAIILHAFGIDIPEYNIEGYSSQIPEGLFEDYDKPYRMMYPTANKINNKPTPAPESEKGLYSFIGKDKIKLALFFDDSNEDITGNYTFTEHGHTKFYTDGCYGSMGEMGSIGYLTCDDVRFGAGSFTVAAWLKIDKSLRNNAFYVSTKSMKEKGAGFSLGYSCAGTMIGLENENPDSYFERCTPFLDEVSGGWIHALYAVDKAKAEVRVYHNFKLKKVISIGELAACSVDSLPFTVGEDASHICNGRDNYIFNIDDLLVFNDSLSEEEVGKLAAYYADIME